MNLLTQLRKERTAINTDCKGKIANINDWTKLLPASLLAYDWESISFSCYSQSFLVNSIYLTTKKNDDLNIAVATGWLISLFDDIKVEKPQINKWNTTPYIRSLATLSNGVKLNIYIYLHRTGECKKVKIIKEVPEEITEAHTEEEYAIICAGEELPEGAKIIEGEEI